MLISRYPLQMVSSPLTSARDVNFGVVYENVVVQGLAAAGLPLWYFYNNHKGEVDFLVGTQQARVLPIEFKSGKDYKPHRTLNNLLGTAEYGIGDSVVLSESNVSIVKRENGK